jgi:hypothetical protein
VRRPIHQRPRTIPGTTKTRHTHAAAARQESVAAAEHRLTREQVRVVVTAVAGGRAKSRRLASALAGRPGVLADGRSPAPRVVGDLLIALRKAGAEAVSPPCCARCGKQMRTFQRNGQDWYCSVCGQQAEPCAACGKTRRVSSRDRAGQPRCVKCPDTDGRDPVTVIHGIIAELDPRAGRDAVAAAVRRSAPRPSYQQKLAWAAILARTLAISTDVAVTWQRHSAGDWITYAADVSRRHDITREDR